MECIHLIGGLAKRDTRAEAKFQSLLQQHDLSMYTKVLMTLVESVKDGGRGEEMGDGLGPSVEVEEGGQKRRPPPHSPPSLPQSLPPLPLLLHVVHFTGRGGGGGGGGGGGERVDR